MSLIRSRLWLLYSFAQGIIQVLSASAFYSEIEKELSPGSETGVLVTLAQLANAKWGQFAS